MEFSPEVKKEFEALVKRYPVREAAMLPTLRMVEREFGKITPEGMKYVAELLEVSPAKVMGVVTFYTHYRTESDGEKVIYVCNTLPCALRGSDALCKLICEHMGVDLNQTTEDGKFTVKKVECLALCDQAPVVQVNEKDYLRVDADGMVKMLDEIGAPKAQGASA